MLVIEPLADEPAEAFEKALQFSSYFRALNARYPDDLARIRSFGAQNCFDEAVLAVRDIRQSDDVSAAMAQLRHSKAKAHMALAGLDLSGNWSVGQVTKGLSEFADASVSSALQVAATTAKLKTEGLCVFGLGKLGAYELNYSSDIDIAAFYDDRFDGGSRSPQEAANRLVREAMRILEERTADGYVFRTDLRLRPDPSSNPLAVSLGRADVYYESIGQNWERMVWIKGRRIAGDEVTAQAFEAMIQPFVWRRHLDYYAIADVRAIKTMINSRMKDLSEETPNCDLKLGPGGIREIEFFVQTQQIILGGRNTDLRVRPTLDGLAALVKVGAVTHSVASDLKGAYETLRMLEHRIQMRKDEQTHSLPLADTERAAVAAMCGFESLPIFDREVFETRRQVNSHYQDLFAAEPKQTNSDFGNLVFTGVDDDPETLRTLQKLGFENPSQIISSVRQWHRARTLATKTKRGRELLTAILPNLLDAMSKTGEPDAAFARFGRFFEGLRSGVQTLSMLRAEPELLDDLVVTLALAPRIADTLARKPSLLETLLSINDHAPELNIGNDQDFESAMNAARVWHGEQSFLIGHQLLHGRLNASDAAKEWSQLADSIIAAMARAAELETVRRYGAAPGVWAVMALGKLGGGELTAGSDLDLVIIYDPLPDSDAQTWFTRFTQRLITALSAETGKGRLYEVDMRLRPSGRAGPVASSIRAFKAYHQNDAWTWEHMALTRIRFIAGEPLLGKLVGELTAKVATSSTQGNTRAADILDMRQRLAREKPAKGVWDLKQRAGGIVDVEFVVQQAILLSGDETCVLPHLSDAIIALVRAGHLPSDEGDLLLEVHDFLQRLQQIQRLTLGDETSANIITNGLKGRLCRAVDENSFEALESRLNTLLERSASLRCKKIGPLATES